jgi:hypothetical protein
MDRGYKMVYKVVTTEYFVEDPIKISNFMVRCRDLWNDYAWLSREHIIASTNNFSELSIVRERCQTNIGDMSVVITDYYGEGQGKRFRDLMERFYVTQIEFLDYVKKPPVNFNPGTDKYIQELRTKMDSTVSELFDLLAGLNPGAWNKFTLQSLIMDIKEAWISQVMMRYNKSWMEDLQALDKMFDLCREMGHGFGDGIIKQFPDRFAKPTTA